MGQDVAVGRDADSTKPVLWMAMELSLSKWKLGFSDGSVRAARVVTIEARDYAALEQQIARAKRAFKLNETSVVRSLYEAGREGFSVHRRLEQMGVENMIVDPASLEVSRHARRAKSDTLDVESLLRHLMAYGANVLAHYRRAAYYVDRILKGVKPADLPVEQPMTLDFVVNMKTAQAL